MGGARGGLASHGVTPAVLSGAALGHDRVRDGTGWGQGALGHGHPASSNTSRTGPDRLHRAHHEVSRLTGPIGSKPP